VDIATALTAMTPDCRFGWICHAHALDSPGGLSRPQTLGFSVVSGFEANSTIP
jgi:hypothetical protein